MGTLHYHRTLGNNLEGKYAKVASRLALQKDVLEIGCHTGYFSRALADRGHRVVGVERNPIAADVAKRQGIEVICGDVEDPNVIASLNRKFDAIVLMDVLEHLVDPARLLSQLMPILNREGRLLVTGPNAAYWAVRKDLLLGRWFYTDAGILDRSHLHFYTLLTWRQLLMGAGYEVKFAGTAEGMFPFQHLITAVPFLNRVVPMLSRWLIASWPQLFAVVLFFEAVPSSQASAEPL